MHSIETQKQVIRMLAERRSVRSIAEDLGISPTTVSQWNREFALEIAETHREELEAVLDDLLASKVQRVRALARAFKKIEIHLQNSDNVYKDYRLFTLLLRLDKYINHEITGDVPPAPPKHKCPDSVINFFSSMPVIAETDPVSPAGSPAAASSGHDTSSPGHLPPVASAGSSLPAEPDHQQEPPTESTDPAAAPEDDFDPQAAARAWSDPAAAMSSASYIGHTAPAPETSGTTAASHRAPDRATLHRDAPRPHVLSIRVDRNSNVTLSRTAAPPQSTNIDRNAGAKRKR